MLGHLALVSGGRPGLFFRVFSRANELAWDFYPAGTSRLRKSEMERRSRKPLGNRGVFLATAEETLLAKLSWFREGGEVSDRLAVRLPWGAPASLVAHDDIQGRFPTAPLYPLS